MKVEMPPFEGKGDPSARLAPSKRQTTAQQKEFDTHPASICGDSIRTNLSVAVPAKILSPGRTRRDAAFQPTGFHMIQSIEINGYRCFDKVHAEGFRRVNVIVGANGSGKTALLEALFMSSSPNPEIALRLRTWRGFTTQPQGISQFMIEDAVWGGLFHHFDHRRPIIIETKGSREHMRSLTINYRIREKWIPVQEGRKKSEKNRPTPVTFTWRGPDRTVRRIPLEMSADGKFVVPFTSDVPIEEAFFGANLTYSSHETAWRFSELSKAGREQEIARYLSEHFGIGDLSIEMDAGVPMVFAKMDSVPHKVPINIVSGGVNRLVPILCAIANNPKGAILIDEIEDGFYYKRMYSIWDILLKLSDSSDGQIFATTHSRECIEAAAQLAEKFPDKVTLTIMKNDGKSAALEVFDGEDFSSTIEAGFDPRP